VPNQYITRRHSAKPLPVFEADRAALRAARHLSRRYNLLSATARMIVEAADIATGEARR
jgi:hypothetical protein